MAEELPIVCKAFFAVCVGIDDTNVNGINLVGISDTIPFSRFPGSLNLCFVLWLTRPPGVCDISLEVYDENDRLIGSAPAQHIEFGHAAERQHVVFRPATITFKTPGAYEVQALADGVFLEKISLLVIQTGKDLT